MAARFLREVQSRGKMDQTAKQRQVVPPPTRARLCDLASSRSTPAHRSGTNTVSQSPGVQGQFRMTLDTRLSTNAMPRAVSGARRLQVHHNECRTRAPTEPVWAVRPQRSVPLAHID